MKVLFPNGKTAHLEKSVADGLIAGGICVAAPDAPGTPKPQSEPACRVTWTLTSGSSGVPMIRGECAACGLTAFGSGRAGAKQVHLWHRGRKETPPQTLIAKVFALPVESAWTQSGGVQPFESLQSSGDPWRDYQTVVNGMKRPADPPPGPVAQAMSGQKDIDT